MIFTGMNASRHIYKLLFFIRRLTTLSACILFLNISLSAQFSEETTIEPDDKNYSEELCVQTDRDIYIAGEEVFFKIYKFNANSHTPGYVSKVVYVDMYDFYNNPVVQLKIAVNGFSGSGEFRLPDTLRTGNYIIRSFTNWMQNFPRELFSYKAISVINPFENVNRISLPAADRETSGKVDHPNPESLFNVKDSGKEFKIKLTSDYFTIREKVRIEIITFDSVGNPAEADIMVSVVKSFASDEDNSLRSTGNIQLPVQTPTNLENLPFLTFAADTFPGFLPELEGHLISGTIRSKITGDPLIKENVTLSFIGKNARCVFTRTDDDGRFNFVTKEYGLEEIVIQPLSADLRDYYVELSDPFPGIDRNIFPAPLYLDTGRLEEINEAIIGMQVRNIYDPFLQTRPLKSDITEKPDFFGDPDLSINLSDYIELTSLREVIKEIIPGVSLNTRNERTFFRMINKYPGRSFENDPLVLLDGVPVYDTDRLLAIKSSEIEKIEILNTRYFISDIIIDGIINIVSGKGDLSVLESDKSVFRQEFHGLQNVYGPYSPDYSTDSLRNSRIPDFRNTLYWNPDLRTDRNGTAHVEFYTSDESGEYKVIAEGFTSDGTAGRSVARLIVRTDQK